MVVSELKDSGVAWIGVMPSNWSLTKLGTACYMKGRIGWQGLNSNDFIDEGPYLITGTDFRNGEVDWEQCYHISLKRYSEDSAIHVRNGDVLFTKDGTVGKVAYVDCIPGPASLNSHLLIVRPNNESLNSRYLFWVLQSSVFSHFKFHVQHGTVMDSVSQSDMERFTIMLPPVEEQDAIVEALDSRIAKLDEAISLISQQLDTLDGYRKSLIQETVTRGLDPNVEMKPSGIDWIGDIPAHWQVTPFKYIARVDSNLVDPDLYQELPEIDPENIEKDSGRLIEVRTVAEVGPISAKHMFYDGQILYSKIRPALNKVAIAPYRGLCSADMYPISTRHNVSWLSKVMRSDLFVAQSELVSSRVKMPKVNVEQLGYFLVPVPPTEEQAEIAAYISKAEANIDSVHNGKRKQLETLKAQRQSLIYEYVTGKRRVV